jgi:hypothetical protein
MTTPTWFFVSKSMDTQPDSKALFHTHPTLKETCQEAALKEGDGFV